MLLKMVPVKRRFLIQYMLCALVPIIAMLILYSQAKSVVINNAYDSSGQMLRRNVQIVESGMQEIRRTCDYLLMNQTIVSFLRTDNPIVDGKTVSSVTAGQRTLATMMSSNNLIDSISVYALRSDMLIDSETSYIRMSGYYDSDNVFDEMTNAMWKSEVLAARHEGELRYSEGYWQNGRRQLIYMQSYPVSRTSALVGNLIVRLNTDRLLSYFDMPMGDSNAAIFIFNSDGTPLLDTAADEQLRRQVIELLSGESHDRTAALEGGSVLFSEVESSLTGWRFISVMPLGYVLERVEPIQLTLMMFIVAAIALGLGLAVMLALRSARPITNLLEMVAQHSSPDDMRSDTEYLQYTIRELIDSNEVLRREMVRGVPA